VTATLAARQVSTISTNWSGTCGSVQVSSTNGWDTNFDNVVVGSGAAAPPSTSTPTRTPTRTTTPTSTPTSTSGSTATFNDLSPANRPLSGQYPSGVLDWGTNAWYLSGPFGAFGTNSVGFNGAGPTSATVRVLNGRRLLSVDAYNGGSGASTLTVACAGQPTLTVSLAARQSTTLRPVWSAPCANVTIGSSNGWDTNFDNFSL
jgi:hypothetical protein